MTAPFVLTFSSFEEFIIFIAFVRGLDLSSTRDLAELTVRMRQVVEEVGHVTAVAEQDESSSDNSAGIKDPREARGVPPIAVFSTGERVTV